MPKLIHVLLVVAIVGVVVYVILPKPHLKLVVRDGKIHVRKGKLPRGFLAEAQALVSMLRIGSGSIRGYRRDQGVTLRFSREFPDSARQRFRNIWSSS